MGVATALLGGCASPSSDPGIGSVGTRAAYSAGHLIGELTAPVADVQGPDLTAATIAGPYGLLLFRVDFKPAVSSGTGTLLTRGEQ